MESKQTYLRDIRDAIKGKERSMAGVSGNDEAKYLKDIADAIRENGGGGPDGNDKVKQVFISPSSSNQTLQLLFSNSSGYSDETDFAKKGLLEYETRNQILKDSSFDGGNPSGVYSYSIDPENGLTKTSKITNLKPNGDIKYKNEYEMTITKFGTLGINHKYYDSVDGEYGLKNDKTMTIYEDNIILSGFVGEVDNTWDGTNNSLKAALAAAKEGNFFITNIYDSDPDDELFGVDKETETINITSITSSSSVVVPMYADKTYDEIKTAMESGLIPLLRDAHRIYSVYGYDFVRGTVIFKDLLSGNTYIQNEEVKTDSNLITFHEPT